MSQEVVNLNLSTFKTTTMDWETRLVKTYFLLCRYSWVFDIHNERFSRNDKPKFTDIEAATIYLFCTTDDFKLTTKKAIYAYANRHLRSWFPDLPKYEAFNHRVNKLSECFRHMANLINENQLLKHPDFQNDITEFVGDSMPIMMAKGSRSIKAKVAKEIAKHGYCATKKIYYHGLKFHALNVVASEAKLPHACFTTISSAANHDYEVFKNELLPQIRDAKCYLDSAYLDESNKDYFKDKYNVTIQAIIKRKKGQKRLFTDQKWLNTATSSIRQPIEGYFNWLIQATNIQDASKTRCTKAILTHVYGKIAAISVFLAITNF